MKNILLIVILFLFSCTSKEDNRLQYALEFAGENRAELKKVLDHYKNDTLKLKAARFLIENMPHHYTLEIPETDVLEQLKIQSVRKDSLSMVDLFRIKQIQNRVRSANRIYDCQVIKADYLIENIDFSFKVWQERPWAKHYSFDDFCQMVLPYRIEHEPLESWKQLYYNRFAPMLDSLYQGTDMIEASNALSVAVRNKEFPNNFLMPFELSRYRASFLLKEQIGGCKEAVDFAIYVLRSLGIPANLDMLYFYYDLSFTHYWVSVKDTTGQLVATDFDIKGIHRGKSDDDFRPKRKIYRQCYEEQPIFSTEGVAYKGIHKTLNNSSVKDVTAEYYGENTIYLEFPDIEDNTFIYLCAFGRKGWVPQAVAPVKKGRTVFKNMGKQLLYFPALYTKQGLKIVENPFFFDGEKTHFYHPDIKNKKKAKLIRKTPLVTRITAHLDNALNISIEYADNPSFKPAYLLHKIIDTIRTNYNIVPIIPARTFRYARCSASPDKQLELAELEFYADEKKEQKLPYTVTDKNVSLSVQKMKDNDPLTYYSANEKGTSLHFDFSRPVTVRQLMFIPRNDDNFIRVGDEYELLFFNREKGWISLGKQAATENHLLYDVPQNAILWLRDLTRGSEEKLFIIENNEQKFYL